MDADKVAFMELNSIDITRKNLFSSTKKIKNVIFLHFFKPKRFFVPRKQQNWEVKNIEITSIIIDKSIVVIFIVVFVFTVLGDLTKMK